MSRVRLPPSAVMPYLYTYCYFFYIRKRMTSTWVKDKEKEEKEENDIAASIANLERKLTLQYTNLKEWVENISKKQTENETTRVGVETEITSNILDVSNALKKASEKYVELADTVNTVKTNVDALSKKFEAASGLDLSEKIDKLGEIHIASNVIDEIAKFRTELEKAGEEIREQNAKIDSIQKIYETTSDNVIENRNRLDKLEKQRIPGEKWTLQRYHEVKEEDKKIREEMQSRSEIQAAQVQRVIDRVTKLENTKTTVATSTTTVAATPPIDKITIGADIVKQVNDAMRAILDNEVTAKLQEAHLRSYNACEIARKIDRRITNMDNGITHLAGTVNQIQMKVTTITSTTTHHHHQTTQQQAVVPVPVPVSGTSNDFVRKFETEYEYLKENQENHANQIHSLAERCASMEGTLKTKSEEFLSNRAKSILFNAMLPMSNRMTEMDNKVIKITEDVKGLENDIDRIFKVELESVNKRSDTITEMVNEHTDRLCNVEDGVADLQASRRRNVPLLTRPRKAPTDCNFCHKMPEDGKWGVVMNRVLCDNCNAEWRNAQKK